MDRLRHVLLSIIMRYSTDQLVGVASLLTVNEIHKLWSLISDVYTE